MSKTKIAANVERYATGRILGTTALALAAVLISGANVKASTLIVTPTDFTLSGWYIDKSSNGTAQISSAQPQSGNASFELAAPANPNPTLSDPNSHDYAILGHTGGYGISFSDLVKGFNNNLSFDYYKSSASTTPTNSAPAYHLYVNTLSDSGFGNQLVWEAVK